MAWLRASGGGAASTPLYIPYLENGIDTNSGQGTAAGNKGYSTTLSINTTDFSSLEIGSLTGSDYGGSGCPNTTLTITGDVSGTISNTTGAFSTSKSFNISNDTVITIKLRSAYHAQNVNYTQRANNIVFS